jgi:hypothetical protein
MLQKTPANQLPQLSNKADLETKMVDGAPSAEWQTGHNQMMVDYIDEASVELTGESCREVKSMLDENLAQSGAQIKQQVQGLFADLANTKREDAILELAAALRASVTETALLRGQIRESAQTLAAPKMLVMDDNGKPIGVRPGLPNWEGKR